jgi:hypothetical protein
MSRRKHVDLADLLDKVYDKLDRRLDEELSHREFMEVTRAVAYLKGTAYKPPVSNREANKLLAKVMDKPSK